ncbi:MAG: outer membrane protein assembly factor BamD [Treponema sp.]|nr:outer membrane protein assembly factor BamD [Treponema sp.]
MKRNFFLLILISSLFLFSCSSTKNIAPQENTIEQEKNSQSTEQTEQTIEQPQTESDSKTNEQEDTPIFEKIPEDEILTEIFVENEKTSISTNKIPELQVNDKVILEESEPQSITITQKDSENTNKQTSSKQNDKQIHIGKEEKEIIEKNTLTEQENIADQTESKEITTNKETEIEQETQQPLQTNSNTEEQEEQKLQQNEKETEEQQIISTPTTPSRSMTVKNNQYIEVNYPGSGWVYIGETEKTPLFSYFGRKLGTENTSFTLRSRKAGKTVLHFYKNDALTSRYIDDYLEVIVQDESATPGTKSVAPSYAEIVPPKPERRVTEEQTEEKKQSEQTIKNNTKENPSQTTENTPIKAKPQKEEVVSVVSSISKEDENVKTIIQDTEEKENYSIPRNNDNKTQESQTIQQQIEDIFIGNLLEEAKKSFQAKDYEKALLQIEKYLETESKKIDEALYVKAQILEADSPKKNIKEALNTYDELIKKYPSSSYWEKANKRKIFLKRFYINIR